MSALDFTARALALRAAAHTPLSFAELAQARLPAHVTRIDSNGFAAVGLGAGTYVSDELADAALHAAHPAAVFAGAEGRHFRLAGDAHGYITPEQLGCPAYAPGTDQRPYIQAAIEYAETVGLGGVVLSQRVYELWAPARTWDGVSSFFLQSNQTGNFIVIRGRVALIGSHPLRATLHCKGPTGGSLQTDYQTFAGTNYIWRGSGIKLASPYISWQATQPAENLPAVRLENIVLFSDAVGEKDAAWPSTQANPNSWDITNKGIYFQNDYQEGVVHAENVDIVGFLGECIYTNYDETCGLIGRNLVMKHTNAQALNPNGPGVFDIDGLYAENCGFSLEGWTGSRGGRIVNAHFKDCGAGGIAGSTIYDTPLRADNSQPLLYLEAVFENCVAIRIGSFTKGRLHLIDTQLNCSETYANEQKRDIFIEAHIEAHKAHIDGAVAIAANAGSAGGTVENVHVRAHLTRSQYAVDNTKFFNALVRTSGSLGPNCAVELSGSETFGTMVGNTGTWGGTRLKVIDRGIHLNSFGNQAIAFDAMSNPVIEPGWVWLRPTFTAGSAAQQTCALPATTNFGDGHEVTIEHRDGGAPNATLLVDGRALLGYKDRVRLRCNKLFARWDIVQAPAPRKASASIDIAATALGAESGPYTIALPGCRPNLPAQVLPPAAGAGGFVVSAVRAGTDQVLFWVRNIDGANPSDPAAATWAALVRGPEA